MRPGGPAVVMRAGFPAGMMKEHPDKGPTENRKQGDDPTDWTYHHIIPENVIEAFWKAAKPNLWKLQEVKGSDSKGALTTLVGRGYRQLREAAVFTLTRRLKVELFDLRLSAQKLSELATNAVAILAPAASGPQRVAPPTYDEAVDQIIADSGAAVTITDPMSLAGLKTDIKDHLGKAVATLEQQTRVQTEARVTGKLDSLKAPEAEREERAEDPDETAALAVTEQMIRWMPGNIHHGPSSKQRRNPKSQGFDPERDDGGDQFEVAARHLISKEQYATLVALNAAMIAYTKAPEDMEQLGKAARELINLTAYSVTEWASVKSAWVESGGWWQIRPRLLTVGGEHTPSGKPRKTKDKVYAVYNLLRERGAGTVDGVYADYPAWTVSTTTNRTVTLVGAGQRKSIGPLYQGAIKRDVAEDVVDDLFISLGGRNE